MAEHVLGPADHLLSDGEMKRFDLEEKPVVVARVGSDYFAVGGKCSHYGAPLEKGVLKGHTLMCPWHHACFDVRSAVRLEPPALNDIPRYEVAVRDGQVVVTLPNTNEREPQGRTAPNDQRVFAIVGGGAAGNAAAEQLRRDGYTGRIVILSAASNVPVDRPNLSKDYMAGEAEPDWIPLRGEGWYAERDIELRLNTTATRLDASDHALHLEGGETLRYDRMLLCTGGIPRTLPKVPGAELANIETLRTLPDADRIIAKAEGARRVVIIGSSFIGMEVAASLAGGRNLDVTVVGMESAPFENNFGVEIGRMFQQLHEENGVHFRMNNELAAFEGADGRVTGVRLKSGEVLPADLVLLGIGVRPATDFLKETALRLHEKDQSVHVDSQLQAAEDVYAAGDIARYDGLDGESWRIEHWRVAQQHGIIAAGNMLGKMRDVNAHVPFFWTNQWKLSLRYVGHASGWDEIIFRGGTPETREFIAFYVKDGQLKAAAGLKHDPEMDAIEFILRDRMPLTTAQMRDETFDLVAYARSQ